ERLTPLHELKGYFVIDRRGNKDAYWFADGALKELPETLPPESQGNGVDVFAQTRSHMSYLRERRPKVRPLTRVQALKVNALLWWMYAGINRREGAFVPLES